MNPKTILIDCDGVLTDGRLHINHSGEKLFKAFHTRDVRAIRELVFHGFEVVIVTADEWEGIEAFAEKVGAVVHFCRDKSELPFSDFIAVGDDAWDVPMLNRARAAFAPADCDSSVRTLEGIRVLPVKGGCGVVAALLSYLCSSPP
jgi:3-deoxy-D-manno-octulosonate 8-phosphate phosphatase KdsC-like HAD superfamily phosphatase